MGIYQIAVRPLASRRRLESSVSGDFWNDGSEVDTETNMLSASLRGPEAMLWSEETANFLYSPGMRIAGGTSEIQRNIIAERMLGLPRN